MASITVYTATAVVTTPVSMDGLEKHLLQKGWFKTWYEEHSNGVVRYDMVSVSVGEPIDLDMVPGDDGNVSELRVLARKEGVIETFQEVIAGIIEPFEVHRADIGIIRRES
jgi:hypothetical protein